MNLKDRIAAALDEDIGPGDVTTLATVPLSTPASARIVAKQDMVVSGHQAARLVFDVLRARYDRFADYRALVEDGEHCGAGTEIATVHAPAQLLLMGERTALNLLMHTCGIATHVASVLAQVGDVPFRVVDTRKTTPLWRDIEKAAVRHGGAQNHRFGLFDGVLIKNNHIDALGSVMAATSAARTYAHHLIRVQVEVRDGAELDEALAGGADALLLDHWSPEQTRFAVDKVRKTHPHVWIEASGDMTPESIRERADSGIDAVSMGGLIHQARWVDLSMRIAALNS